MIPYAPALQRAGALLTQLASREGSIPTKGQSMSIMSRRLQSSSIQLRTRSSRSSFQTRGTWQSPSNHSTRRCSLSWALKNCARAPWCSPNPGTGRFEQLGGSGGAGRSVPTGGIRSAPNRALRKKRTTRWSDRLSRHRGVRELGGSSPTERASTNGCRSSFPTRPACPGREAVWWAFGIFSSCPGRCARTSQKVMRNWVTKLGSVSAGRSARKASMGKPVLSCKVRSLRMWPIRLPNLAAWPAPIPTVIRG